MSEQRRRLDRIEARLRGEPEIEGEPTEQERRIHAVLEDLAALVEREGLTSVRPGAGAGVLEVCGAIGRNFETLRDAWGPEALRESSGPDNGS